LEKKMTDTSTGKTYERILVKAADGNTTVWERPFLGNLVMKTEGGKTVIEKTGLWGSTITYMPSDQESVEAESW
jgi:hypothetical protein